MARRTARWLLSGASSMLATLAVVAPASAQDITPEEVARIGEQRRLIERDTIELEGRFESLEGLQRRGNCELFELSASFMDEFLDKSIGDYGTPTGLPSRRNVFQAAETRLARIRELGCPLPASDAPPDDLGHDIGGTWAPVRDIRFRGNYSRGVRAPSVVELFGTGNFVDVDQTGIGVTRDGPLGQAPEMDAVLTDGKISTFGIGAALHLGKFSFYGSYQHGSGETLFDVQPNPAGFNGVVFGQLSEAGSSGTGSGSASVNGFTRSQVARFRLGGDMELALPTPTTRLFFAYDYFRNERTHDMGAFGTVVFPTQTIEFSQIRDQRISDNFFAAGFGAETLIPLDGGDGGAGLSARLIGVVEGFLLDSNLSSFEQNQSNFGPASDRNFTIDVRQSEQSFGATARGQINLEYTVSPSFAIFVGGTAEWFSDSGAVFNPNSGDQVFFDGLTTTLVDGEFWSYGAMVGLRAQIR